MTAPLVRRSPVHTGEVVAAEFLAPRLRRVTVRCAAMSEVTVRPAQDLELHLRDGTGRRVKRRYTIRRHRPSAGEVDLDVVLHGAGPGAQWGASAQPGDEVAFQGPRGKLELRAAATHLLIGDESALPAMAAIAEALPSQERALAVVEVQDESDQQPFAGDVRWVRRRGRPAGTAELLRAAVGELAVPSSGIAAYLLGETRAMVALRAALEERGVPHEAIFVKGYWNLGRPDRIAGRPPA